jgi:hypothetical protein
MLGGGITVMIVPPLGLSPDMITPEPGPPAAPTPGLATVVAGVVELVVLPRATSAPLVGVEEQAARAKQSNKAIDFSSRENVMEPSIPRLSECVNHSRFLQTFRAAINWRSIELAMASDADADLVCRTNAAASLAGIDNMDFAYPVRNTCTTAGAAQPSTQS